MSTIPLHRRDGSIRAYALVDPDDFEALSAHRWSYDASTGYAVRWNPDGAGLIRMHRQIMGLVKGDGLEVDHKNLDRLDNQRSNLRVVRSRCEQMQNLPATTGFTSRHRGVSYFKQTGRWRAHCQIARKQHHLGYFATEDEAATVVQAFRREHMPYSAEGTIA